MASLQELRRRWTDQTNETFSSENKVSKYTYPAANYEREFDFKNCEKIVFEQGSSGRAEDVIMMTKGSGHLTLPAGVQVTVENGYVKWAPVDFGTDGSTVVGQGVRAPPASRVGSAYAPSSVVSSQSGGAPVGSEAGRSYQPDVPRGARHPADDFQVVAEMSSDRTYHPGLRDDASTVLPDDSVSAAGLRAAPGRY